MLQDNLLGDIVDGDNKEGFSRNPPPPLPPLVASFTPKQWATIINLIRTSAVTTPIATMTPPPPVNQSQRKWKVDNIGFFDPSLNNPDNIPIITVSRHLFYRDIYTFINRLKDMAKQRSTNKLRTILPKYFRREYQIQYSIKLGEMEKDLLRSILIKKWYNTLIKRFKTRILRVLKLLQIERYTFVDARNKKHPRTYLAYSKTVGLSWRYYLLYALYISILQYRYLPNIIN